MAGGIVGQLRNPAIVGTSATVYSDHIEGVSTYDLLGRGIALCRDVQNGQCLGQIPFCCTIERDSLPAMEMPIPRGMEGMGAQGMEGRMGGPGMMGGAMGPGAMGGDMSGRPMGDMGMGAGMGAGMGPGMGGAMGGQGPMDNNAGGLF